MSILSLLYTQGGKKERVDIYSRVVIPLAHEEQQRARKKKGGGDGMGRREGSWRWQMGPGEEKSMFNIHHLGSIVSY